MQTLVDIPDHELKALDAMARKARVSRDALIQAAVTKLLATEASMDPAETEAFGLWSDRQVDGLDYQEKIRGEW